MLLMNLFLCRATYIVIIRLHFFLIEIFIAIKAQVVYTVVDKYYFFLIGLESLK